MVFESCLPLKHAVAWSLVSWQRWVSGTGLTAVAELSQAALAHEAGSAVYCN